MEVVVIDDVGVGIVAMLEKDSERRIFSVSDNKKCSLETACTDEVQILFNFRASFQTFTFFRICYWCFLNLHLLSRQSDRKNSKHAMVYFWLLVIEKVFMFYFFFFIGCIINILRESFFEKDRLSWRVSFFVCVKYMEGIRKSFKVLCKDKLKSIFGLCM